MHQHPHRHHHPQHAQRVNSLHAKAIKCKPPKGLAAAMHLAVRRCLRHDSVIAPESGLLLEVLSREKFKS